MIVLFSLGLVFESLEPEKWGRKPPSSESPDPGLLLLTQTRY